MNESVLVNSLIFQEFSYSFSSYFVFYTSRDMVSGLYAVHSYRSSCCIGGIVLWWPFVVFDSLDIWWFTNIVRSVRRVIGTRGGDYNSSNSDYQTRQVYWYSLNRYDADLDCRLTYKCIPPHSEHTKQPMIWISAPIAHSLLWNIT